MRGKIRSGKEETRLAPLFLKRKNLGFFVLSTRVHLIYFIKYLLYVRH